MEIERSAKETVVTQVSVGGFDIHVTAKDLVEYLERAIGVVWRCRLKTSWTPPESYPDFEITDITKTKSTEDYRRVVPHAFVHFALTESTTWAMNAAGRCELFLNNRALKVSLGPENPFTLNQRRRTIIPFKLSDVGIEIGTLVSRDKFFVGWRGPPSGANFLVDPFDGACSWLLHLGFWYRTANDDIDVSVPFDLLDDDDPWIRTTDFTPSGAIGRCHSYRVSIPPRHGSKLGKAVEYLEEQRVRVENLKRPIRILDEPDFGMPMSDPFFCIHHKEGIAFEVLFLVNAVMHKGIFNQHQLSNDFFDLLRNQHAEVNVSALKHICTYRHPVFNAYSELKAVQGWLLKNPKVSKNPKHLGDIIEVRRLVITPTKAYCLPPEVELSNRVLRKYIDVADRFLRVTFMDEGLQRMNSNVLSYYVAPIVRDITSSSFPQKTRIFKRVRSILTEGFYLCGRRYSFLAFSSNQLRDQSAWFFAEERNTSVLDIKSWMGKFTNRNIAKCSARMGQCFSSTYATVEVPPEEVNSDLPDIERNGYVFSDGIGIITPDLAREVAEKLKLDIDPPCAYQIRYAGCKGVVACWPEKGDGARLSLRMSMNKFQSNHTTLEICSWTRFQPGFLNRQIVTLLSSLNVPDEVFWKMQETMVSNLNQMLVNSDVAFDVLTASCADQENVAALMLSAGFEPHREPHLRGMLTCIRAAQLWGLREKARIFVPSGRWLMGCLDELGVLEQGQCFIQVSNSSLEKCFVKHGAKFSETKKNLQVVKGTVKGERPHTNEASGSDLDGDLYFVTWDENLIPPSKRSWTPMQYDAAEAKLLARPVNHKDIIEFFAKNMVNENLGSICNAHVVHADLSEHGAMDENCLTLAELAATAVDFPKTGKIVSMPSYLKPKMYPDFMGKEEYQSYKSEKILGRLYRQIKDAYDKGVAESSEHHLVPGDIPYDSDLEVVGASDYISDAWDRKCSYDGQLNGLLSQYKVKREEEVVTGHIWSMPKYSSRKQGELKDRLKHSYNSLKKEFRQIFEKMDLEFEQHEDGEKNKLYEQKASAWYQVAYHPHWVKKSLDLQDPHGDGISVMLSFAWIAADYLARIKIRHRGTANVDSAKPVNSLAKYLADRM
ncbi:RNA-dependent RNA polymerase [Salix viminalis]|uniref:RNA-dependent RNA polymerase n=1 Tax=Salix viminalis TaxID=40686 RepID=A0A9Q0NQF9_SALVM|nr:RNA-dependent RNA polymerase [Salix viminalis]